MTPKPYRGGPIRTAQPAAKPDAKQSLMCHANGCPRRWSVSPGQLCSLHAWAKPQDWPSITASEIARQAHQLEIA